MSNYNFDGQQDGDWEERGDLSWNEFDWQKYLKRNDKEVDRFIELYNSNLHDPNRLDTVAHIIGWDADDWAVSDPTLDADPIIELEKMRDEDGENDDNDPYTILRHPVFIVARGLYRNISRQFEALMAANAGTVDAQTAWEFAKYIHSGEENAMLAVQALDVGDYTLAVCQMKLAMNAVNDTLKLLPVMAGKSNYMCKSFIVETHRQLFDLREVYLRVMTDCRDEIRRNWNEGDN
mgnify:CR=1 FL=1